MSTVTIDPAGDTLTAPIVPPVVTFVPRPPTPGERFLWVVLAILFAVAMAGLAGHHLGEIRGRREVPPPIVKRVCPYDCRWCRWHANHGRGSVVGDLPKP